MMTLHTNGGGTYNDVLRAPPPTPGIRWDGREDGDERYRRSPPRRKRPSTMHTAGACGGAAPAKVVIPLELPDLTTLDLPLVADGDIEEVPHVILAAPSALN